MAQEANERHPKVWWFDKEGKAFGRCKGCGNEFPALGLAVIQDRMVFGRFRSGGPYCCECKPREFGRPNGHRPMALEAPPHFGEYEVKTIMVNGVEVKYRQKLARG